MFGLCLDIIRKLEDQYTGIQRFLVLNSDGCGTGSDSGSLSSSGSGSGSTFMLMGSPSIRAIIKLID
jgi:hypothetical protein